MVSTVLYVSTEARLNFGKDIFTNTSKSEKVMNISLIINANRKELTENRSVIAVDKKKGGLSSAATHTI